MNVAEGIGISGTTQGGPTLSVIERARVWRPTKDDGGETIMVTCARLHIADSLYPRFDCVTAHLGLTISLLFC